MQHQRVTRLTDQQQAVVEHGLGPARVFAVAGAGKTTAMVHRIRRLVQNGSFPPSRILASTFSKLAVRDISSALLQWSECAGVHVKTLHSLGLLTLRLAQDLGYLPPHFDLQYPDRDGFAILHDTLRRARKQNTSLKDHLEQFDQDDFLDHVGRWKGDLCYPDLHSPSPQKEHSRRYINRAAAVRPGFEWYIDLYRLFEEVRLEAGKVTYDDMLFSSWELLSSHSDLAAQVSRRFDCLLIDEFQDVNRAQFEILDLIAASHRNLMVVGDDDQTIYEWRGANSGLFLNEFSQRYPETQDYIISDNFRCKASHIALANQVIRHNRKRQPKHLSLTQGMDGLTVVQGMPSRQSAGQEIASTIKTLLAKGLDPEEIAVLVRVNAQTSYIEPFLIQAGLPYRIRGGSPFYERPEILVLLDFFHLAAIETSLDRGQPLDGRQRSALVAAWNRFLNPLMRYIPREIKQNILAAVLEQGCSLLKAVRQHRIQGTGPARAMDKLTTCLEFVLEAPVTSLAWQVLDSIVKRTDYSKHLLENSGNTQAGQGRAANVAAFLEYTRDKGTIAALMVHLEELSRSRTAAQGQDSSKPCITISTIHQAKGLEWTAVFVPDCNQGTIPYFYRGEGAAARGILALGTGPPGAEQKKALEQRELEALEEERRLFYVAITRTRRELYLYFVTEQPISSFLREASYEITLKAVESIRATLKRPARSWETAEIRAVAKYTAALHLERFLTHWWEAEPEQKEAVGSLMQHFLAILSNRPFLQKEWKMDPGSTEIWRTLSPIKLSAAEFPVLNGLASTQAPPRSSSQSTMASASTATSNRNILLHFKQGQRVSHGTFGRGVVKAVTGATDDEIVEVAFDQFGTKRILAKSGKLDPLV